MREYDIYLRDRLTQGYLIVQSIPFRDGISATDRIVIDAAIVFPGGGSNAPCILRVNNEILSKIEIASELRDAILKVCEIASSSVEIGSDVKLTSNKLITPATNNIVIGISGGIDLFSRDKTLEIEGSLSIDTDVSVDIHWSFGDANTEMLLDITENGNSAVKYITVDQATNIVSEITSILSKIFFSGNNDIGLNTSLNMVLRRYRELGDMDSSRFADIDNLPFSELDYIEVL